VEHLFHSGSGVNDELLADAAAAGITLPERLIKPKDCTVWVEHWPAVVGLDYGVVLQMASLYQIQDLARVMEDLQIMELRARDLINKAAAKEAK
jgi:hypothetical protein